MIFEKNGKFLELKDPNTFNIAERYGFKPAEEQEKPDEKPDDTELAELKAKAKELGIRNAHSMGREKLLEKIAEAEKGA